MADADISVALERRVAAPPALLWALVSDSNRVDRMLGAGRVTYRFEADGSGSMSTAWSSAASASC